MTALAIVPAPTLRSLVGSELRQLREAKGWTQAHLAARAGLEQTYVSRMELGGALTVENLYTVVRALGCSMAEFFKGVEQWERTKTAGASASTTRNLSRTK